jgi:hypothetical protein
LSCAAAIAAFLVIPFTQADARPIGARSGGSVHISGARSIGINRGVAFNRGVVINRGPLHVGSRRLIVAGHPHLRHRHLHRHFFFGSGIYAAGLYDTCWRWVPGAYGWRRVWVCDPYPYY